MKHFVLNQKKTNQLNNLKYPMNYCIHFINIFHGKIHMHSSYVAESKEITIRFL